ncbi:hypothetical protein [Actinocorallia populi]|uniref:hypothetical protein n=1 Tax=Actinocorallia populi TaxID=2079200 RepID=UPI00130072F8|nr:hypothetical protein [Actinocorallia populi]
MRAAAFLLTAVLVLLVPGGGASADEPPYALTRLDRVATALEKDPFFIDEELLGTLDAKERKRIRTAIRRTSRSLGMPVFVLLIPNPSSSEADGRNDVFLHWLHDELGKDGLYLMADHEADLEVVPFEVPRDIGYMLIGEELVDSADPGDPFADLPQRIEGALDELAGTPPGEPATPRLYATADPFGRKELPVNEPETWGSFWGGLFAGLSAVLALYGIAVAIRGRYRSLTRSPHDSPQPRVKSLRALADEELARLAALMPPPDDAPGRLYVQRSYDAARFLSEGVGPDPGPRDTGAALDLVGVIVLARQGREILEKDLLRPLVPCRMNPLHGPGVLKRKVVGMPTGKVCRACADVRPNERGDKVLRVPGGYRYHEVDGRWKRGYVGQDLAERVLESLSAERFGDEDRPRG